MRDAPPPSPTFSQDDLLAALAVPKTMEDGLTTYELAQRLGRSQPWVAMRVRDLVRSGRAEASKAPRPDLFGAMRHQPVYRLRTPVAA